MKKLLLLLATALLAAPGALLATPKPRPRPVPAPALTAADSARAGALAERHYADSVHATLRFQHGRVTLPGGVAALTVPPGFRYLDSAQSAYVLHKFWDNPRAESLGMLFPDSLGPLSDGAWAYNINYNPMGYVKDDDAGYIDADELLETLQQDAEEDNPARIKAGYQPVHVYGWGAAPYYDPQQHALHWAKLLRFGSGLDQTLNYNVRVLGRKGVLVFNAIAGPEQLAAVRASIPGLLANVQFTKGQQYTDYSAGLDEVAAYSIGGLVAGKVLAKVGLFALATKFWKLGLLALAGAWAGMKRFFGLGSRPED
ncbi:DUF2167 domain-containing protein [Hymenobacter coccineus]|uniref:DUF2167 domain-containing protein n=1 Tax=Hymenobacter coccineus TaxID=1908235 RepID=A0A1G1TES0_9BACT|nr:DUF2167 domain-containing protein [Hymenobacter coccineus]OGX89367.1 hypothetical protein BEN49_09080 [Hymenobacter coccineus]